MVYHLRSSPSRHSVTNTSKVSVLVLEYGTEDRSNITKIPYYATTLNTPSLRPLTSVPEPQAGNQTFSVLVSQVAGGGSQVNGMAWNYGSAGDYDAWELLGNPGWAWNNLSSYVTKVYHSTRLVDRGMLNQSRMFNSRYPSQRLRHCTIIRMMLLRMPPRHMHRAHFPSSNILTCVGDHISALHN